MKEQKGLTGRRKYDDEFKCNAVRLIENGQSVRSVSESLGIGENQLYKQKYEEEKEKKLVEVLDNKKRKGIKLRHTRVSIFRTIPNIYAHCVKRLRIKAACTLGDEKHNR